LSLSRHARGITKALSEDLGMMMVIREGSGASVTAFDVLLAMLELDPYLSMVVMLAYRCLEHPAFDDVV
jgi:hypothetical protein